MATDKEELFHRYEKLPQAVKDAMFAEASADKIEEIGRKHGLLIDKIGALADEVGYFMLGMTHPQDFKGQLVRSTGLSETKVGEIIEELNKTIFLPIRDHLSSLHNVEESGVEMPDEHPMSFATGAKKPEVVPPMIFPQSVPQAYANQPRAEDKIPPAPDFIKTFASQEQPQPVAPTKPTIPAPQIEPTPTPAPPPQQTFKANDPYHETL